MNRRNPSAEAGGIEMCRATCLARQVLEQRIRIGHPKLAQRDLRVPKHRETPAPVGRSCPDRRRSAATTRVSKHGDSGSISRLVNGDRCDRCPTPAESVGGMRYSGLASSQLAICISPADTDVTPDHALRLAPDDALADESPQITPCAEPGRPKSRPCADRFAPDHALAPDDAVALSLADQTVAPDHAGRPGC